MALSEREINAIKENLQARQVYPGKDVYLDAVYFPWDEPLVGQKVVSLHANHKGIGVVESCNLRVFDKMHDCPCCKCEELAPCAGWWQVKWQNGFVCLEYPPSLQPAKDS